MTGPGNSTSSCPPSDLAPAARNMGPGAVSTPSANGVSTPRRSISMRLLIWWGQRQINLGLLIPVSVRRGGWRQRLADGLIHRGADCLVRAYRMGAKP